MIYQKKKDQLQSLRNFDVTHEMLRKRPEMLDDGYVVGDKVKGSFCMQNIVVTCKKLAKKIPINESLQNKAQDSLIILQSHRQEQYHFP
ncbi:MAG: hypothetical protein Ct9H90mP13_08680 [Pseudomonadota bacterium]|nr:MAG: hypothetical protein Ct9H90mP13_08680 [Pseudomonadota bacterium]